MLHKELDVVIECFQDPLSPPIQEAAAAAGYLQTPLIFLNTNITDLNELAPASTLTPSAPFLTQPRRSSSNSIRAL
jgi:hypothetical protein